MEVVEDNWSPIPSMNTLKYFLADATKHKAIFHQLYFIGLFFQEKVKNIVIVNWKVDINITFQNTQSTLDYP